MSADSLARPADTINYKADSLCQHEIVQNQEDRYLRVVELMAIRWLSI